MTVLTTAAAAAVAISSQAANAAPSEKPSKDEVKAKVDKLYEEAEQATEKYNGAKEKQEKLQKEISTIQDNVARGQEDLNVLRDSMGLAAAAQYRTGSIDSSLQLFLSSNPDDYLDKASTADQLSAQQVEQLKKVQEKQRELAQQRASRSAADRVDLGNTGSASGRAMAAFQAAQSQIGKPYVYGATGTASYDCSGLTSWAYGQAGVSIPRTSQAQASYGTHLSMSELKVGDLVIFYGDQHHVGFYAGNGQVLHAPRTGTVVRYESINNMPFQFGVRI